METIVKKEKNETVATKQQVDANEIVSDIANIVGSIGQFGKSIIDLQAATLQAEKEIMLVDRQIDQFVMELNNKQKDREDKLKEVQALHMQMDNLISKASEIALRPDVNEVQLKILQLIFATINNCINKLPQL